MSIQRGEYVRPNNPNPDLPRESVWYVVSAAARFHAEQEEQAKRRGNLSRRLGPVFAEVAMQAKVAQPCPSKAYKPAHGGYPA